MVIIFVLAKKKASKQRINRWAFNLYVYNLWFIVNL